MNIEKQTKEYQKFSKYYSIRDQVLEKFLRSNTFLPFGLESLKYPTIFTSNVPLGAPAATDFKHIFINPEDVFFSEIKVDVHSGLTFAYLHETCHNIFNHSSRGIGKDQHLWGYATDFFINLFLRNIEIENKEWDEQSALISMKIDQYSDKILFSTKFENMIEEEIYAKLQKDGNFKKKESQQSYKDFLDGVGLPSNEVPDDAQIKITETELNFDGKNKKKTFVEFPKGEQIDQGKESEESFDSNLAKTMFESRIMNRGFQSSQFEKFIKRIFKVSVPWDTILKDSILIELQKKGDINYSRPRLAWLCNPTMSYLANITEEETLGTAIIAIDSSGSVNDDDIAKAINLIEQSSSYYKDLIILIHDTKIVFEKKYTESLTEKDIDELLIRRACGGTNHSCIFQRVIELSKQNDALISIVLCITDLFSDIEESQKILSSGIPRIYIRSNKEYNTEKITGKIINIE